jgi:hypothetical protein
MTQVNEIKWHRWNCWWIQFHPCVIIHLCYQFHRYVLVSSLWYIGQLHLCGQTHPQTQFHIIIKVFSIPIVSFINMTNCMWYRFHPLSLSMPCTIHPTNFITNLSSIWGSLMSSHFIHIRSVHLCGDLPWWNNVRFYLKYVRLWVL